MIIILFLGKPSKLEEVDHPDWTPSQNLGHETQAICKRKSDLDRTERTEKRRKILDEENKKRQEKRRVN